MSGDSIVLDSSVWIEILSKGNLEKICLRELKKAKKVIVPTLVIFEIYRKIVKDVSEDQGLLAVALISQYEVFDLTKDVALTAADISLQHKLPMADSIVLACARQTSSKLITLDNDFAGIEGVKILRK